jgi:hypothetical protein
MPTMEGISMIDTDRIRHVGMNAWTESHNLGGAWESQFLARYVLSDQGDRLLTKLSPEGWTGEGYLAFEAHMTGMVERMRVISDQCGVVGDVLVGIANEFEMQWYELVGLVIAAIALILAAVSVVLAIFTAETVVGAIIFTIVGAIFALAGFIVAYWSNIKPRLDELAEATERFNEIAPPGQWVEP